MVVDGRQATSIQYPMKPIFVGPWAHKPALVGDDVFRTAFFIQGQEHRHQLSGQGDIPQGRLGFRGVDDESGGGSAIGSPDTGHGGADMKNGLPKVDILPPQGADLTNAKARMQ